MSPLCKYNSFPYKISLAVVLLLGILISGCNTTKQGVGGSDKWIDLFNGKDLRGWTPKIKGYPLGENYGNTFKVENGNLVVSYDQYDSFDRRFGHLFYKSPFSSYKLLVEYRFVGDQVNGGPGWAFRNSGAMLHCQDPKTMTVDQDFPISIEAQFLGGNGTDLRTTSNLCTPGMHVEIADELITRHCTSSTSKTYHGDQWVTVEMVVLGSEVIYHIMEGDTVLTYQHPQIGGLEKDDPYLQQFPEGTLVDNGYISLQSESHRIEFRKVALLDLSDMEKGR